MKIRAFKQVDVFTSVRYYGNSLAVILDAEGLTDADMQRIAAWTNLSETTFVLATTQPQADYRVRIFTPRSELPFAGHPSVGTAHALLEAGRIAPHPGLIQECIAGLLPVRVTGDDAARRIFVRAPQALLHAADTAITHELAQAFAVGLSTQYPPRVVNVGPNWLVCDLGEESVVRSLDPDMTALATLCRRLSAVGVGAFGRAPSGAGYGLAVRAFCPADGIPEDPVTGSANAAIGAYLRDNAQLDAIGANYRVSQGREVGRDGFVDVRVDIASGEVEIGGQSVTCIDGVLM